LYKEREGDRSSGDSDLEGDILVTGSGDISTLNLVKDLAKIFD
jgi:hypothetical protein